MILLPKGLFEFQDNAVSYLIDRTTNTSENNITITMKSPTGSGKTVILIAFIDRYLEFMPNENVAFVWLTPGSGELEEQSKEKMERLAPHLQTQDMQDVLNDGFNVGTTTFINWEQVTKKNNRSITDNERKNLFEHIANAHRSGIRFILIIDEEHSHNTAKAQDIINAFSGEAIIRVSATAKKNPRSEWYEIKEEEVIQSGLIKKALYINEGLELDDEQSKMEVATESNILLELADKKRMEILKEYEKLGLKIRPLVIIQFPSSSDDLIKQVEEQLSNMGYTYENKMVAKWMADTSDKINLEGIEKNDAYPSFLLIKQAIATGWDCPRSHILVKLREHMDENFEIQTIGRIRRMPEAKHYDVETLDCCYLYTFDEKYKETIINNIDTSYEVTKLFLKPQYKSFQLPKENRDLDYDIVGIADIYDLIYNYFVDTYKLTTDKNKNREILKLYDYKLEDRILGRYRQGRFVTFKDLLVREKGTYQDVSYEVNTHLHGIDMMHSIDMIKKVIKMSHENVRAVLLALFSNQVRKKQKLLNLNKKEWYAFIINNATRLRDDFRKLVADSTYQMKSIEINPKISTFKIPEEDFFKYDPTNLHVEEYLSNVYKNYTNQMTVSGLRSTSEQLFEMYCERNEAVEWVYKNGDTGQQYLSIVYLDTLENQWLFYPDYIVKLKNGDVWIIETKGGEVQGRSKNIDERSEIKFKAFKNYAIKNNLNWGFVRDKDQNLFLNNTLYTEEMNNENWRPLKEFF
jgi:type III restriction enzyme